MACSVRQPAVLTKLDANTAALSGDLTHVSVVDVLPQGLQLLAQAESEWLLDMQQVGQLSSAAVALLLEWLRAANKANKSLVLRNFPQHLWPLIRISDLETVFDPLLRQQP